MNMQPWQEKLWADIETGGVKPGEMMTITAVRGTGKSLMNKMNKLLDRPYWLAGEPVAVDGEPWRSVVCINGVEHWIREQDPKLWFETSDPNSGGRVFDIAEPLYLLLMLRWPK
jgi:hypothetical protein